MAALSGLHGDTCPPPAAPASGADRHHRGELAVLLRRPDRHPPGAERRHADPNCLPHAYRHRSGRGPQCDPGHRADAHPYHHADAPGLHAFDLDADAYPDANRHGDSDPYRDAAPYAHPSADGYSGTFRHADGHRDDGLTRDA